MRLGGRRSSNVEDRRGMGGGGLIAGGGIGGLVIAVIYMLMGGDPADLQTQAPTGPGPAGSTAQRPAEENVLADRVSGVLADTEDVWREQLPKQAGMQYREPRLVMFTGATQSGCGVGQAAVGPFYCPADQKVYIDLSFYKQLQDRFGAPGDFAQAYVIAHEVGHHVQHMLGTSDQVRQAQQRARGEAQANALSVRLELQADCYAGIWAHHAQRSRAILEQGDVEEALNAAGAIGDDKMQEQARGRVRPESFTHGSSEQRMQWFQQGFKTGSMQACDTFGRQ
jgi:predicted metalloprotease